MQAAVEGRGASKLQLLAVTVLTSLDRRADLADLGYPCTVSELVELRVRKALEAAWTGSCARPWKWPGRCAPSRAWSGAGDARRALAGAGKGDQKRVATPAEALSSGADYLVIGRADHARAPDPAAEARRILAEIQR